MKKTLLFIAVSLFFVIPTLYGQKIAAASIKGGEVSVATVLNEIKSSYDAALKKLINDGIRIEIDEASLTFSLSESKSIGGGLQLWILKIGRKRTTTKSSSVTFNLSRSVDKSEESIVTLDKLATIIYNGGVEFDKLSKSGALDLHADDFSVEVSFGITSSTEGGAEIKIFSAEGSKEKTYEHSFTLKFKKPKRGE